MQAWGGPDYRDGSGASAFRWPDNEHGIFVDHDDNVWITGNGNEDAHILKFTSDGRFLLQIGEHGASEGSNDTANLGRPAELWVYEPTNEVFVADGYANRRVAVFDADTGAYKRHWGAYGSRPEDDAPRARVFAGPGSPQFNLVHGIGISNDGIVYVGDRVNNRIQAFQIDGTFVNEVYIQRETSAREGTGFDVGFSADPEQQYFFVPDRQQQESADRRSPIDAARRLLRRLRRPRRRRVLPHSLDRDRLQRHGCILARSTTAAACCGGSRRMRTSDS